jgi:hypothetical protein
MKKLKAFCLMCVLVVTAPFALAVTVTNPSFEDDGVETTTITGWTPSGAGGSSGTGSALVGATDGTFYAYVGDGATLYQVTSEVIAAAGHTYTLTVDVFNSWNASPQIALFYTDDGGTTRTELDSAHYLNTDFPNAGTWLEPHTLTLEVTTTVGSVGKNLGIELSEVDGAGSNYWAHFDNVRLSKVLVPEAHRIVILGLDGDLHFDCVVDLLDLAEFANQWLDSAGASADFVGDDGVDFSDFAVFARNWQRMCDFPVVINEIHHNPDGQVELVEFVELYNPSPYDVDISGWRFCDGISYGGNKGVRNLFRQPLKHGFKAF